MRVLSALVSEGRPPRAGTYAAFEGSTYRAYYSDGSTVQLLSLSDDVAEAGFTRDEERGFWFLVVPRSACTALFYVATSAYFRDVFPVWVEEVFEDRTARVSYLPGNHPAPAARDADGRLLTPPLRADPGAGYTGRVPVEDLSGAVQRTYQLDEDFSGARWITPRSPDLPPRPA